MKLWISRWTGTLFHWGSGDAAGPALLSNDSTCTVPDLHADTLPTVPGGHHYLRPNVPVLGRQRRRFRFPARVHLHVSFRSRSWLRTE